MDKSVKFMLDIKCCQLDNGIFEDIWKLEICHLYNSCACLAKAGKFAFTNSMQWLTNPAYMKPLNISSCEDSSTKPNRLVCQDRHFWSWVKSLFARSGKTVLTFDPIVQFKNASGYMIS